MGAHGDGTISRYGDGRTVVRVTMNDGSRRSSTLRRTSRETEPAFDRRVKAALRDMIRERDAGIVGPSSTLGSFLTSWSPQVRESGISQLTWERYDDYIRRFVIPKIGHVRITDLRAADVDSFLGSLEVGGQTKRHVRAALRRALADAMRAGFVVTNAAALAKPPTMRRIERTALDADQAKALLSALEGHPWRAFFVLALHTGMREAEILGLRWNDWNGEELHVRRTLQRVWTGAVSPSGRKVKEWKFLPPKTDRSRRTVQLTTAAMNALHDRREIQAQNRGAYSTDGLIFTTERGHPIHGTNLTPVLQSALKAAGLPHVTIHDLRHSSATILYANGVPLETIADILGHSTPRITAELYRHRVPRLQRAAVEALSRALG